MEVAARLTSARLCVAIGLLSLLGGIRPCEASEESKTEPYPDGKPHLVYTVDSQGRKSGQYKELDPEGHVVISATYQKDVLNGPYTSYFPNRKVKINATYTDGKLASKYSEFAESGEVIVTANYKAGALNGQRQEFTSGKLTKKEVWKDGKLTATVGLQKGKMHGWRREFAAGRVLIDEFWFNGELIVPKGPRLIDQRLADIEKAPVNFVGDSSKAPDKIQESLSSANSKAMQEQGLRKLMAYRFLCELPYQDMRIDRGDMAYAQAGAEIVKRLNKLTHTPENPGMPDDEYKFASHGAKSNLCVGTGNIADSVAAFMDDSDDSNIAKIGHRRWCLNPPMLNTGFGFDGGYSAMWSLDGSRKQVPDYDAIAFPPRGLIRSDFFRGNYAWNISFNPDKYKYPDASLKVVVMPVRFDPEKVTMVEGDKPLELEHFNIDDGFGVSNCVIFRPKNVIVSPSSAYIVNISGLKDLRNRDIPVKYFVGFYDRGK
jgi:hypothetical protein